MDPFESLDGERKIIAFDALLFSVILETALRQLTVAEGCSKLRQKVSGSPPEGVAAQDQAKLEHDRELLTDVLRTTLIELVEEGNVDSLKQAVANLAQQSVALETLRLDYDCQKLSRITRSRELKTKRKIWQHALRISDNKITMLRDRKEDELQNAKMRLAYAEKWLNARSELLELNFTVPSKPVPSADHEKRVNRELCRAYNMQIEERERAAEHWRLKYAEDTNRMYERLAGRREQLSAAVARREQLQKLYDLHAGEIRSWVTFKKERAMRLAREERTRKAATRVQSWWRGVMVRRALGAYKNLKNTTKKPSAKNKKK